MSILPDPSKRSTVDLVVLGLAGTVCVVLVLAVLAVIIIEAVHPEVDTTDDVQHIGDLLSVVIGAIVGFVGGRGSANREATQSAATPPPEGAATDTPSRPAD